MSKSRFLWHKKILYPDFTLSSVTVILAGISSLLEASSGAQCERKGWATVAAARAACLAGVKPAVSAELAACCPETLIAPGVTGVRSDALLRGWQDGQQYTVRPDMSQTCTA